jgi:glycerophosphoryl diester phosphodiesterase
MVNLEALYAEHGTLVFGHRGASAYAPQNTLAAFSLAAEMGAHGVELDVHLSADGHLVVIHDFSVDKTTDGSGEVVEKTLAELKELDAGVKFAQDYAGARVPTLDEVFETIGKQLAINIEIKGETHGIEDAVAECVNRHNALDSVIVSSFNPLILRRMGKGHPDMPLGFLSEPGMSPDQIAPLLMGLKLRARHPHFSEIDRVYMNIARLYGYRVNTWTVNDTDRALALAELNVDTLITDRPDDLLAALGYSD